MLMVVRQDITLKDWLDIQFEGEQYIVSVIGLLRAYKEATKGLNHDEEKSRSATGERP